VSDTTALVFISGGNKMLLRASELESEAGRVS